MGASTLRALYPSKHRVPQMPIEGAAVEHPLNSHQPFRVWHFSTTVSKGTILLLHGYFSNRYQVFPIAKALQEAQWDCLVFELRGHGQRKGIFTFGRDEIQDLEALLPWIDQQPSLNRQPLHLLALSTGAYIACRILKQYPNRFKAVVFDSLFSSLKDAIGYLLKEKYHLPGKFFGTLTWWGIQIGLGMRLKPWDPEILARVLETPVLAIHSEKDRRVPIQSSQPWFDDWAGPKQRWVVPESAHVCIFQNYPHDYIQKVSDFLRVYSS